MSLLLWTLGSLLAISFIGDLPGIALVLTGLAGIGMGLSTYADHAIAGRAPGGPEPQVSRTRRGGWLPASVFNLPMLAFVVMLPSSLWASPDLTISVVPLVQLLVGIAAFYVLCGQVNTASKLGWAVSGLVAVGVFFALLVPVSLGLALAPVDDSIRQALSVKLNPNSLAGGLAPILAIAAALFLYAPLAWLAAGTRRYGRTLFAVALVTMSMALLLTRSRGGMVAFAAALLLVLSLKRRWMGSLLLVTVAVLYLAGTSWMGISRSLDLSLLTGAVDGLPNREEIWWRAVFMLQRVPYTGIGLGVFSHAVPVLYPMFVAGPGVDLYHAHNLYLQVGVDLGIPGLAAFIALLVVGLVVTARRVGSFHQDQWTDERAIALGLGAGLVAIMVHGLVDCPLWNYNPAVVLWVVLGLIGAVANGDRTETHPVA